MGKQWERGNFCTLAPDKIFGIDLSNVCYEHDIHYLEHGVSRLEADIQLRENIKALGLPVIAWIYYFAVRLFGWVYY